MPTPTVCRCLPALLPSVLWLLRRVPSSGCPRFEVLCQGHTVSRSPRFTPAQVSPGTPVATASLGGTELSHGPDPFRQYRKAKTFLNSRSLLYNNDKILSFPSLWCRVFMGIFLQVFSFQYKTQLTVSRDSWWKGGQGGTQGVCPVFKAGYCKGLRSTGSGLGFKHRGTPGFPKFCNGLLSTYPPCSFSAPSPPISLCLFPAPENPLLLVSS